MKARFVLMSLVLSLVASLASAATSVDISFTPTDEQEGVFLIMINRECALRVASNEAIPAFCTINPDGQTCTCTPNDAQRDATVKKLFLDDQFIERRRKLYTDYGRELGAAYPNLPKAVRDTCDTAVGRPVLP